MSNKKRCWFIFIIIIGALTIFNPWGDPFTAWVGGLFAGMAVTILGIEYRNNDEDLNKNKGDENVKK